MHPRLPYLLALATAAPLVGAGEEIPLTLLTYWNFNNTRPAFLRGGGALLGSFNTTAAVDGGAYLQTNNAIAGRLTSNSGNGAIFVGSIDFENLNTLTQATLNGKAPAGYNYQNTTSGAAGYGAFAGYTLNAMDGDVAGDSLLLLNTDGKLVGKHITLRLSSLGYDRLSLSYAVRLTNTIISTQVWSYSTDGQNYSSLTTITPDANGTARLVTLDLSSLSSGTLNNQAAFYLRMTYRSANAQGSQAIDNLQLSGTAITQSTAPQPALRQEQ